MVPARVVCYSDSVKLNDSTHLTSAIQSVRLFVAGGVFWTTSWLSGRTERGGAVELRCVHSKELLGRTTRASMPTRRSSVLVELVVGMIRRVKGE